MAGAGTGDRDGGARYKISMEHKDMVKSLLSVVSSFTQDRLVNKEQRLLHKDQCAERLAADDGNGHQVRYSDQAILANLDWGIDALEEAINTSNLETKLARLDYAEKMLQVCAMLDTSHTRHTAGVPNSYLSAWSHLYLAFLWKLRNNTRTSLVHILDMFIVDPFFSRIDFAPDLWKAMFLPHMNSILGWYSESRHRLVMQLIPDSADDLSSFTADFGFFNESVIFSMRPDQADKLQKLELLYGQSLNDNTKLYAKYYKDCVLNYDSAATSSSSSRRLVAPMLPIAEPPMTPLHEVSRSIPDYVKFGPILPTTAGFSTFPFPVRDDDDSHDDQKYGSHSNYIEESTIWSPKVEPLLEENECYSGSEHEDTDEFKSVRVPLNNKSLDEQDVAARIKATQSSDSTPKLSSSSPILNCKENSQPLLRLLSSRQINDTSSSGSNPATPRSSNGPGISSPDSKAQVPTKSCRKKSSFRKNTSFGSFKQTLDNSCLVESEEEGSQTSTSTPSSGKLTPQNRPPKDFVCPITGQLLSDPVTLETGQTYERKAIQEWLARGNSTCPITRQPLSADALPKTNYVLKRLITSWRDEYPDIAQEFSYSECTPTASYSERTCKESQVQRESCISTTRGSDNCHQIPPQSVNLFHNNKKGERFSRPPVVSTSPTSVISQASADAIINGIKPYTSRLCTSEELQECEEAVLTIARTCKESKGDPTLHSYLSKPTIVNGFAEILLASVNRDVLRAAVYILSHLIYLDDSVGETLTSVDSDFDCLAALLNNGLVEASVLIYQLRPAYAQLCIHELIPSLVQVTLKKSDEGFDDFQLLMDPKDAALALLEQTLIGGDECNRSVNALTLISANGLPHIIDCLERCEGRRSVVSVLLCCMRADTSSRYLIANRVQLAPVLELFDTGDDNVRGICIDFLSELVCLNRRTFCNQILKIIKDEGPFSTMHTFLVYLQMAPMEQQPAIACLLLQLDLLVEPRKMSIYREEAIEILIEALSRKDLPTYQTMALDAFASLSGYVTASGKSVTESWLLKIAGLDQSYNNLMKVEMLVLGDESMGAREEEEKAAQSWMKHVAFVLCNHENGCIFKALEECLKSNSLGMARSCLIVSTWLTHMLTILPDTGVREIARHCLLNQFINILQSSRNLEEKALATVALRSFLDDKVALKELGTYAKSICKSLRKLKRSSVLVEDILKALMNLSSVNATELWSCAEVTEVDSGSNGEILSLAHVKGRIFSSHSDGTIKVWDAGKRVLRLIHEAREHTKAVTCLFVHSSGDKLYSGSLDKTIRVWVIKSEEISCIQVHEMKETVLLLVANSNFACYASQGTGIKIYNWSGFTKQINFNKYVKCLAMTDKKLYCGCIGYTIQEIDLSKYTTNTLFSGVKKLLGKHVMYALHIHDNFLIAGGSSVDGAEGKVFSLVTGEIIGSLVTGFDIHCVSINNDFIFTGSKCGIIDVWLRERLVRVGSLKISGTGNTRVTSLISDPSGEMLFAASSDAKIQAWALD